MRAVLIAFVLMAGSATLPAVAQEQSGQQSTSNPQAAPDNNINVMITQQRETYSAPPKPKPNPCGEGMGSDSDITVCAYENGDQYRLQGNGDAGANPQAKQGLHLASGGVGWRGCVLQKCPKTPYLIDLKSIPEAPAGSDADKIAKGEMRAP